VTTDALIPYFCLVCDADFYRGPIGAPKLARVPAPGLCSAHLDDEAGQRALRAMHTITAMLFGGPTP